jgi:hypothetical protein
VTPQDQIDKGAEQPNFEKIYRSSRNEPEKAIIAKPLISNDKDLWTKTRLHNVFVSTMLDMDAIWGKIEQPPPYHCIFEHCKLVFDDPEEFITHEFEDIFRVNAIVEDGKSRDEFVRVTMTPGSIGQQAEADSARMKEGARK